MHMPIKPGGLLPTDAWPITYTVPNGVVVHEIPPQLRSDIARLLARKSELLFFRLPASSCFCGDWFRASMPIYEELTAIEDELRALIGAAKHSCVEYFAGGTYRCIDAETATREYLERCKYK